MDKKLNNRFSTKHTTLSSYFSKLDQTNPIEFHIKNNFFSIQIK